MSLADSVTLVVDRPHPPGPRLLRWLGPGWPLKVLLLGVPIWWALGVFWVIFILAAVVMAGDMVRRGRVRLPTGFGIWVLFLIWMAAGVMVLWAHAPGTLDGGGLGRLVGFGFRALWYLAITVAMLYPLSFPSRVLPASTVARWLAYFFLFVLAGGLLGVVFPSFGFTSPMELVVPGAQGEGFLHTMIHPSVTTQSEFLGYEQPRPKAPFAYANSWGNGLALLLPFFVLAWGAGTRRWQKVAIPFVLLIALVPVVLSLNRGLWLGLAVLTVYAAIRLAVGGRTTALLALVSCVAVAAVVILATPLSQTLELRLETPHSNERRASVGETVVASTWEGSPLLGFGTTRQVQGSFSSIAGGETPDCHQCGAPPMGTQGFLWRLIFTTGFVGTALFYTFMALQFFAHVRRSDPVSVAGCMVLTMSLLFFIVYDSLESPLFILMLAIGLMNRERLEDNDRQAHLLVRNPR